VIFRILAVDYDGTVADHGRLREPTRRALGRVRASGRKLVLVTGRRLGDLRAVCPDVDDLFDLIVAENGALLVTPHGDLTPLGDPPEPALLEALRQRDVPVDLGASIIATHDLFAETCLGAIRDTGVERTLVFNKGALMLLPGGVTKRTGLEAALAALHLSPHGLVGIGDAENDHAFLAICECAVAVADAVPALRERADHVTRAPGSQGVTEFIDEHLLADLATLLPRLTRHCLPLGEATGGEPVRIPAHRMRLLVVGPATPARFALTRLLVERLVGQGRAVFALAPEGHDQRLDAGSVVVLGGTSAKLLPAPEDVGQLLRQHVTGLVLDLSAMDREERSDYASRMLAAVAAVSHGTGIPQWVVVDDADQVFPAHEGEAPEWLRMGPESLCLVAPSIDALAPGVRSLATAVAATDLAVLEAALGVLDRNSPGRDVRPADGGAALAPGEAVLAWRGEPAPAPVRFRVNHGSPRPAGPSG
jgi:hydroxymethylpyrimidine pyrophosphatase-like HAD family hydrolase